ncbi:MAG: Na+/H+ antiporter NhaA [Deltaproteobacteria bacterium]|nr:Na+/H+ antiporter NhaA [Deltaproteobacteria bacterium]MBL7178069.1 Na+/H+ antiporter NhaA [Desulfobacteraceae bacterium]
MWSPSHPRSFNVYLVTESVCAMRVEAPLVSGVNWGHILGASMLGGIGFTMSLFISGLSFSSAQFLELSKLGIILDSVVSGGFGLLLVRSLGNGLRGQPSNPE